jgi:hypothetical protein
MAESRDAMTGTAPTWCTWRQALSVVAAPRSLKRSGSIALIVGSLFFAMNQLDVIMADRATALVWAKVALTFLTPLVVSNIGMLSATRKPRSTSHP